MTYALAWKNEDNVFMAADTAITTTGDHFEEPSPRKTSFNRDHFYDVKKTEKVEERVVKLFLKNNVGLNFAGDYRTAYEMARSFYEYLEQGCAPMEALAKAIFTNVVPKGKHVQISVGYYDSSPKIIHFDSAKGPDIIEVERIQMGNPPVDFQDRTNNWIDNFEKDGLHGPDQFMSVMGILHSYSLINDTLPYGIGGVYTGLIIDSRSGEWQPDVLYIEYGSDKGKQVGVCMRHDCLVVSSPVVGQSRCLSSSFLPIHSKVMEGRYQRAIEKGKRLYRNNQYEYLVILSHENTSLVVIEMRRKNKHMLIWLEEFAEHESTGTKVAIFPELKKLLNDKDTGFRFVPYIESEAKSFPQDNVVRKDIKYG